MKKLKNVYDKITMFLNMIGDYYLGSFASSASFCFLLSVVPIMAIICTLLPYLPIGYEELRAMIDNFMPEYIVTIISLLYFELDSTRITILSLAIITAVFSAGGGIYALMNGLNFIYDCKNRRSTFFRRLLASIYMILFMAMMIALLIGVVYGDQILELLLTKLRHNESVYLFLVNFKIFKGVRLILVTFVLMIVFMSAYTFLPDGKIRFKSQLPGAFLAALAWSGLSYGFAIYINIVSKTNIYGSLTIFVAALIWLYACMFIVLIGALFNKVIEHKNG